MKPLLIQGTGAPLVLSEELVSAIHKAFEAAVEVAVQEVTRLVGQAAGDVYENMRRENESLQQRLQSAEALLQTSRVPGQSLIVASAEEHRHESRPEEPEGAAGSDSAAPSQENPYAADASTLELQAEMSLAHLEKVEGANQPYEQQQVQDRNLTPPPRGEWRVTVKQERAETPGSPSCSGLIKVEDFTSECMLETQSKMLEEWKPEVPDTQNHHSHTRLSCTVLAQAHQNVPPAPDLPSLSSDFPNIFQLPEVAPLLDTTTQVHVGVQLRSGRSPGLPVVYACKSCDQTFHLPSLLRRHQGQCQQRSQPQPQAQSNTGKKRRKYYPQSGQPFYCSVCNRAFNRMENLKTHLRIHTGERPYTCSVCSMCFRHSGALTRHFRIHTGEKPYVCGQCGKSYRNAGGLKFHQGLHNREQL